MQDEMILTGPTPGPDGEESEIEVIVFKYTWDNYQLMLLIFND